MTEKKKDPVKIVTKLQEEVYRTDREKGLKYPKPLTVKQIRKGILELIKMGMSFEEIASQSRMDPENVKLLAEGKVTLRRALKIAIYPKGG